MTTDATNNKPREFNDLGEAVNAISEEVNNNLNYVDYEIASLKERCKELEKRLNDLGYTLGAEINECGLRNYNKTLKLEAEINECGLRNYKGTGQLLVTWFLIVVVTFVLGFAVGYYMRLL